MPRYDEQILEEIKSRLPIEDVIGNRIQLKRSGSSLVGCCPFHQEKTPSFHVNSGKQFYHCFGCGESGDIFKFLMRYEGLTFQDAVERLAAQAGVKLVVTDNPKAKLRARLYSLNADLAAFYQRCLSQTAEAAPARDYLAKRKLSDAVVEAFGIGYAPAKSKNCLLTWADKHGYTPEEMVAAGVLSEPKNSRAPNDYFDRFRGRLMFPIRDTQGRVVAFSGRILDTKAHPAKYVNSPETEVFTKGRVLYALDRAAAPITKHPRREVIVCEGQIDVIRCHASGFDTAIASQGTAFTPDHVKLVKRYADCAVLVFDGDNAGRKAALRTGALFLAESIPVRVAALPPGDDPDSMLRDRGPQPFQELLDGASSITEFQIETLRHGESSPDSIDAVNRISRKVLEMLSGCPAATLRSRLLQEASDLLHLPFSALEEDLDQLREQQQKRAAQKIEWAKDAHSESRNIQTDQYDLPTEDVPGTAEDFEPGEVPPDPPPLNERLLCELLIECEHQRNVLELIRAHLPVDMVTHPFAQSLMETIFKELDGGEDLLPQFCQSADPKWQPLIAELTAGSQKLLCAQEISPEEAAKDLITAIWIAHTEKLRGQLNNESSPVNDAQRLRLTCLIKSLRNLPWDKSVKLMHR
ncbi:MAG: DNA primase [Kiritimatiellae bacterium]|nr:DNA primase [Kiritimatiellia bacterium]